MYPLLLRGSLPLLFLLLEAADATAAEDGGGGSMLRAQRKEISSLQSMTVRWRGGGRAIGPSSSGASYAIVLYLLYAL